MDLAGPAARVSGAESSRRLLRLLLCFTEKRPVWTATELAAALGMSMSMVYRYVALLREVGLVDAAPENRYRLTDLTSALAGAAAAAQPPIADFALPVIARIRDEVDETVLVARRSGWRVYTVERIEAQRPVRLQFEPGQAMNLHTGALSRVLLAAMPDYERQSYLHHLSTDEQSRPLLQPESLAQVLRDGFAESFEEIDDGIWGVAAPITSNGTNYGAIGCAAPLFRTPESKRDQIRDLIVAGAEEIVRALEAH